MQILTKQVGWALSSCISKKLELVSVLLVSTANLEEQGFKGPFPIQSAGYTHRLLFSKRKYAENWPVRILGQEDSFLGAFDVSMESRSTGENVLLMAPGLQPDSMGHHASLHFLKHRLSVLCDQRSSGNSGVRGAQNKGPPVTELTLLCKKPSK